MKLDILFALSYLNYRYVTNICHWRSLGNSVAVTGPLTQFHQLPPNCHVKGKAVPLQAWSGPEVSRKLRFPDYMTTAQDGVKVVSLKHRPPLPPGNIPGNHFC
jgi:hypothetical protein